MSANWNCDGSGPHCAGEVRVLPLGSSPHHGNLILCRNCYHHEIAYREDRNLDLAPENRFALPAWDSLQVYGKEARTVATNPHKRERTTEK